MTELSEIHPSISKECATLQQQKDLYLYLDQARSHRYINFCDWLQAEQILLSQDHYRQTKGDIADHRLGVTLYYEKLRSSKLLNPSAATLIKLLCPNRLWETVASHFGIRQQLTICRAQSNFMREGDFNRFHRDTDYDVDYRLVLVYNFTDPRCFQGGELAIGNISNNLSPAQFSITAFHADTIHRVNPIQVAQKERVTFILILGRNGLAWKEL